MNDFLKNYCSEKWCFDNMINYEFLKKVIIKRNDIINELLLLNFPIIYHNNSNNMWINKFIKCILSGSFNNIAFFVKEKPYRGLQAFSFT